MDYLSLCCIAKDENAFIVEWAVYHAMLGVERLIIYDNDSRVPLAETLAPYAAHIPCSIETITGPARQLDAYAHCLETHGASTHWLGFIDVDEFLLPRREDDLRLLLTDFEDHAGLGVNWVMFGSSGHEAPPLGLLLENYTRRSDYAAPINLHIKSIVKPRAVHQPLSPHHFAYKVGNGCVGEGGFPLPGPYGPHHNERIQLNHYFFRSRQDFREKIERGRGDMPTSAFRHNMADFDYQLRHYTIPDRDMERFVPQLRERLAGNWPSPAVPADWEADSERLRLLLERNRPDLAESLSRRLVAAHAANSGAWSLRALALALLGRHGEAHEAMARSFRIEQTVENLYQLFRIQTLAGDTDEARRTARYISWRLTGVDAELQSECAWILEAIRPVL
ncbi:protein of unknown function DUF23 [Solidesulfovibrio fructosivorans JJ]]|uniref:Glycosyl transferase family 2 n=1 Tax=Solidesulfovibrio fructosivorans JJ] TaxID=596151 RepID=E1JRH9_SOLFR|nr:glycosyltransferase family 2 protein [Solidesulfovibrio fructosivorans]EFL53180.1 protein of unknown function DUF23 [Solidesulfovibrio fructosivorans JJ]]